MEPPSPIQALGVNPFPSRFIIRTVPRGHFARRRWEEPITTTKWHCYCTSWNSRKSGADRPNKIIIIVWWAPDSAQSRRSYGKIGDCEQSTRSPIRETVGREAPPWGPTLHPFIYHLSRTTYPFRILSINKWYPFHRPCLELCIPFNCFKCTVF